MDDNSIFGNAKAEDTVNVLCYNEEQNVFFVFENAAIRGGLSATVSLPQSLVGYEVIVYAFCMIRFRIPLKFRLLGKCCFRVTDSFFDKHFKETLKAVFLTLWFSLRGAPKGKKISNKEIK